MTTSIYRFAFNPLQENTYLLVDKSTKEAVIVDPGCSSPRECEVLSTVIEREKAKPVAVLATHLHFDHIWGVPYVTKKYGLPLCTHRKEMENALSFNDQARSFMIPVEEDFNDVTYQPLDTNEIIPYGECQLRVLFTPGHSRGHVTYYNKRENFALCGDVVFQGNIGRCDLDGGNYGVMMNTLRNVFVPMPDNTILYPGHGPETTILQEKKSNPYIISQL